jgi:hypothetical protein
LPNVDSVGDLCRLLDSPVLFPSCEMSLHLLYIELGNSNVRKPTQHLAGCGSHLLSTPLPGSGHEQ